MPGQQGSFEIIDHTADVAIRVRAPTLPDLFVQAAKGMYAVLGRFVSGGEAVERRIELTGRDAEDLLHDWLSELLWDFETGGRVYDHFDLDRLEADCLVSRCRGSKYDPARSERTTEIKAVTYHGLRITRTDEACEVTVIFDI